MMIALGIILVILLALAIWVAWIEPRMIVIKRLELPVQHLSHPLTAAVIGDLQPNRFHWPTWRLRGLFARIADDDAPDIVLWLGDFYNGHTEKTKLILDRNPVLKAWVDRRLLSMDEIADAMAALPGRIGAAAVLGNHDWAWSAEETIAALTRIDVPVLRDEILTLRDQHTGAALQIVGYEDISSGRVPAFSRLHSEIAPDVAAIVLSHSPDAFPHAKGSPDLMISGHTHGGQVRLPFFGPILLPVDYPKYDRGLFHEFGRRLFVTSGLGTSLPPLRFLVPPEIAIVTLTPATAKETEDD